MLANKLLVKIKKNLLFQVNKKKERKYNVLIC